jgi:ATP-dependent Lon protease
MSKIESYIQQHRQEFDDEIPSEQLWQKIAETIPGTKTEADQAPKKLIGFGWKRWAAAACIIGLTTFGIWQWQKNTSKQVDGQQAASTNIDSNSIALLAPEALPEVNAFAKQIAQKQQELKQLAAEQPQLYNRFASDIAVLDSTYRLLQQKLNAAPNQDMLIEAMIDNLQMQLNILNQQLQIINKVKNQFKKV